MTSNWIRRDPKTDMFQGSALDPSRFNKRIRYPLLNSSTNSVYLLIFY